MSSIVELLARVEADRQAMEANPTFQMMKADILRAAAEHRTLLAQFDINPGMKHMLDDFRGTQSIAQRFAKELSAVSTVAETVAQHFEPFKRIREELAEQLVASQRLVDQFRVVEPPAIEPTYWAPVSVLPMVPDFEDEEVDDLAERTIVRPELKRTIGFSKNGFRRKD